MKIQVRRSILTFQWQVQTCEDNKGIWITRAVFKTKEEADKYAQELQRSNAPKASKVAKAKVSKPKAAKVKKESKNKKG